LPRELRNLVYAHLWKHNEHFSIAPDKLSGWFDTHVLDVTFLGQKPLVELAEEWYHNCVFSLDQYSDMANFLESAKDLWGLPHLDLTLHVRQVSVPFQPSIAFDGLLLLPRRWELVVKLQKLSTLTIDVERSEWLSGMWFEVDRLSEELFPVLKSLVGAGVKITICDDSSSKCVGRLQPRSELRCSCTFMRTLASLGLTWTEAWATLAALGSSVSHLTTTASV
jgi:hypothetical protein